MKVVIIGGGFIGQLLQHLFWRQARIFDWRVHAPSILARSIGPQYLWEPIPEMECRRFMVHTTVDGKDGTTDSIRAYKQKVGKDQDGADWRAQFRPWMPGYECQMPAANVEYGKRILKIDLRKHRIHLLDNSHESYDWLISTIPLPSLLTMCGYASRDIVFKFRRIYVHKAVIGLPSASDDMHVNYISAPTTHVYRQTIRDGCVFTESLEQMDVPDSNNVSSLMPGKIYAHPATADLLKTLREDHVLCFGRYASWSPDELAHETLRQVREYRRSAGYV